MSLKLHSTQKRATKVLVAAKFAGVNIEVPAFNAGVDNKTPEYLKKAPTGKYPILETSEGVISEANAIVRHIARVGGDKAKLYGKNTFESGLVDQWIDFAATEIDLPAYALVLPIQGVIPNNGLATKKAQEDIKKVLSILDSHLLTRTYLVGNQVTAADIVVAASLVELYELVLDVPTRQPYTNTNRWFTTIVNQPEFLAVVPEVKLAEKAAAPAKVEKPKAEKAEKPKEEKKAEKPKEEKKPAKMEEADEEEEESFEDKEDNRKKNPLDLLPKSKLVLDEWKRMYSNNDTRSVALPWFWEHYDPEGYSMYWATYKYNHELSKVFMTNNLITGLFQRLEKLHKYAFGSVVIFGDEPNLEIRAVWVFRGQGIPADMTECDEAEHYEWKPVDLHDASQKELVQDYFAWDGNMGGKKFNCAKAYK